MRWASGVLAFLIGALAISSHVPAARADPGETSSAGSSRPKEGDDPFGYARQFREQLAAIGQISAGEFALRYPPAPALRALTWDPTQARFWDRFQEGPEIYERDATRRPDHGGRRLDFRLSPDERDHFRTNGFVVSERLGAQSFGRLFYWIYSRDLPVFISSDALLHAWHRSYDAMLEDLEQTELAPSLETLLAGMAEALPAARPHYAGFLQPSVRDADLFLAVGRSLLKGQTVACVLESDARLDRVLEAVAAMQVEELPLFGRDRIEDFSQYKPRGHYTNSPSLERYFRAMMWCGRTDLRIAGSREESSPRELGAALILRDLLIRSGRIDDWRRLDLVLERFIGRVDSMTFDQLGEVLEGAGRRFPQDFLDAGSLDELQASIVESGAGRQAIRSHLYASTPFGADQVELPASFTFIGQRFTPDSWALSKVVADDILWDGMKVQRRVPSALDVAFAVLGNNETAPALAERMETKKGRPFRDGLNYQHNLAAVRAVFDSQRNDSQDGDLYAMWLGCLRELSNPTTDPEYPETMRTRAWAAKTVNTQLASWSQLRHDTILYVKQSATCMPSCEYPAGYVEPRPEFWRRFQRMAESAATLMEGIDPGAAGRESKPRSGGAVSSTAHAEVRRGLPNRVEFLRNFARQLSMLAGISEKELAGGAMSAEEVRFLKDVVEIHGFSGPPTYSGWYPGLFYKDPADCMKYDALVADVHTDPPSEGILGDPGCILEQGVGRVDLLMGAFDCGTDRTVYAGPVLSHYEFESSTGVRLSDPEWQERLEKSAAPPRPDWTRGYLVPGSPAKDRN